MPNKKLLIISTVLLLIIQNLLFTENFRVRAMHSIDLGNQTKTSIIAKISYNDAISINFPKNTMFLRGLEIEVKLPQELLEYPSSIAYGLYTKPHPSPTHTTIDYSAEQINLQALPARSSAVIQIPLQQNHRLKTNSFASVLPSIYPPEEGPLIFRLFPIMKGLPNSIEDLEFIVHIKPFYIDEGAFRLSLNYPTEERFPVNIRVNEESFENTQDLCVIKPGEHHLSIVSEEYRSEVRIFTVEQAEITEIQVNLKDTMPYLFLTAPENALVFLNDDLVETIAEPIALEPKPQTVRFVIGDYEITKVFTVEKGRDYSVSMIIDVHISETP